MRVYTASSICKYLRCGSKTLESIIWSLGYGRHFERKYTIEEVRAIMAMYYESKGAGWRRKRTGPGVEPGSGG